MSNKKSKEIAPLNTLVSNPERAIKGGKLKEYVNQAPPVKWIKKNKLANNSSYLPIDKVELMLDVIFQEWKVEVLEVKSLFNAVECTIRLHYIDPTSDEWKFHDGVGAKELQTKAKTGPVKPDFSNISRSAVEIAVPIAKTQAIKDASHHLGKLFGRDLNRKDVGTFVNKYEESMSWAEIMSAYDLISENISPNERVHIEGAIARQDNTVKPKIIELIKKHKQ